MTRAERLQAEVAALTLHERTQIVACVVAVLTEFLHGRRASERGMAQARDPHVAVEKGA